MNEIRNAVFQFCDSTNQTTTDLLTTALAKLREELAAGLQAGEAQLSLSQRVYQIFHDPYRAHTIAATETSRAMHGGQLMLAKATGLIRGKRWLASADACDFCLSLNGKEVPLDHDFAIRGTGAYAHIPYPPGHPRCMCTFVEVLGGDEAASLQEWAA